MALVAALGCAQPPQVIDRVRVVALTPELRVLRTIEDATALASMLCVYEDMFVQHRAGLVGDETWMARSISLRAILPMPGGRRIWQSSTAYRQDFQTRMESELGHEDSPAAP